MAREPEQRYESVKALKQDLQAFVDTCEAQSMCLREGDIIIRQDEPATTIF